LEFRRVLFRSNDSGPRLRLLVRSIEDVAGAPRYVRMSVAEAGLLTPGRAARCYGVLGPPAGPMAPGAYDFARRAYFERLGATGFAFGRCRPLALEPPPSWLDRQRLHLAAMRTDLAAAIYEASPGRGGAISAALVTGDRSSIDAETDVVADQSDRASFPGEEDRRAWPPHCARGLSRHFRVERPGTALLRDGVRRVWRDLARPAGYFHARLGARGAHRRADLS